VDVDGEQKWGRGNPTQVWSSRRRPAVDMVPWAGHGRTDTINSLAHCLVLPKPFVTIPQIQCPCPLLPPSLSCARKKGPLPFRPTPRDGACRRLTQYGRLGQTPIRPSQAETGFPELFHRWCSPLTFSVLTAESSPTHLPKTRPRSRTDWLAGSSTPPLLFVSIPSPLVLPHLDNKNPGTPRPTLLLLLSWFSPSPSPPNVAVMSLVRPGPGCGRRPPEPTTRDNRLDRPESSLFSLPKLPPDAIDVIAPPATETYRVSPPGHFGRFLITCLPGEPPLPPFLTPRKTGNSALVAIPIEPLNQDSHTAAQESYLRMPSPNPENTQDPRSLDWAECFPGPSPGTRSDEMANPFQGKAGFVLPPVPFRFYAYLLMKFPRIQPGDPGSRASDGLKAATGDNSP
jgi:hypothetical protein